MDTRKNGCIKQISRKEEVDYESMLTKPRRMINIKKTNQLTEKM